MGKVLSLLIGTAVTLLGLILMISWWYELLFVLRGTLPVLLVFTGVIAVIAGLSELKDALKNKV